MGQPGTFYPGFDKFLYMRRDEVEPAELAVQGLLQATPERYSVLSQADFRIVLCTSPTIVDGRLYLRQANAVACYDLRSAP